MTPHIEPAWAAGKLVARFVAHVGEVATQTIRQRPKLIGIDVILVHRMLKSPLPARTVGRTLAVAGAGMPYMLGLRRRRHRAAVD